MQFTIFLATLSPVSFLVCFTDLRNWNVKAWKKRKGFPPDRLSQFVVSFHHN